MSDNKADSCIIISQFLSYKLKSIC